MQNRMMITGAGSGLGREIALRWAREGWRLALCDVNEQGLAETLKLVREAGGRVCDFRGGGDRLLMSGQLVAGNLKISDALQKTIVSSGYAASFNG